jgi:hypothetical protein
MQWTAACFRKKNKTGIGQISFSRKYGNEGQTNIDRRKWEFRMLSLIETMSTWTQAGRHQRQETLTNSNEPSKTSVVTGTANRSKRWWWTGESRIKIPKDALIRDRFLASWTFPSLDEIYLQEREVEALPKQKIARSLNLLFSVEEDRDKTGGKSPTILSSGPLRSFPELFF